MESSTLPRRTVSAPVAEANAASSWQPANASSNHQALFKRHKVLPHPRKDASYAALRAASRLPHLAATSAGVSSDVTSSTSTDAPATNLYAHRPYPKELGTGPNLPPTPPAHSRNSSATYSALPPSASDVHSPESCPQDTPMNPPFTTTPTKQMSPPTPDVTPPRAVQRAASQQATPASQSHLPVRNRSKGTIDSRSTSFTTARENPWSSSSDEDAAVRPNPALTRTQGSTVRDIPRTSIAPAKMRQLKTVGLGLGLESSLDGGPAQKPIGPDFSSFDGEWSSRISKPVQQLDGNLDRNAVARTRLLPKSPKDVVEDVTVSPSNATKAVRSVSLPQRIASFPSPNERQRQAEKPKQQQQQRQHAQRSQPQPQPRRRASQNQREHEPSPPSASAAPTMFRVASSSELSTSDSARRLSTVSTKSAVSTVVEAFVAGAGMPQRQRTLRHVKKKATLRDLQSDAVPSEPAPSSLALGETGNQRRPNPGRTDGSGHDSMFSTTTFSSISSRTARREILKAGGIPVVVIPTRRSSIKSTTSREPSLRSTRSRRSQSLHSTSQSQPPKSRDISPANEARGRYGRVYNEPDGSAPGDQRTIDYPPVVPRRSSSLSAPTSRNVSRAGSLTAESVKTHSAFLASQQQDQKPMFNLRPTTDAPSAQALGPARGPVVVDRAQVQRDVYDKKPVMSATKGYDEKVPSGGKSLDNVSQSEDRRLASESAPSPRKVEFVSGLDGTIDDQDNDSILDDSKHLDTAWVFDHTAERLANKHLSPHNTPFSMVSVETATTHHSEAEVSEALVMNIYPHQNTSVLVVDHSNHSSQKDRSTLASDSSISKSESARRHRLSGNSVDSTPLTPHRVGSMGDVDSPLRNPRSPPTPPGLAGPPIINFIPATPSGLTPSIETDQIRTGASGFEDDEDDAPVEEKRGVSGVLQRALSRGRGTTRYGPSASRTTGLLTRTFSLTRRGSKRSSSANRAESLDRQRRFSFDDEPAEENKLHPFWRPASSHNPGGAEEDEETYRYPPIDNRPRLQRSLSERMKRTFAILPLDDDDDYYYPAGGRDGPERRTVRRTPSGNLRVVKYRRSLDSLARRASQGYGDQRPTTAPEGDSGRRHLFWRTPSLKLGRKKDVGPHVVGVADATSMLRANRERKGSVAGSVLPAIGGKIGEFGPQSLVRRLSERRRERRSNELRQKISGPQVVRDGVGDVIRRTTYRDAFTQAQVN